VVVVVVGALLLLPFVVYLSPHTAAFDADPVFVDPLPVLPVEVACGSDCDCDCECECGCRAVNCVSS